jgi:hypothetical protein
MRKIIAVSLAVLAALSLVFTGGCGGGGPNDGADNRATADYYIKKHTTYVFDGLDATLMLTDTVKINGGFRFTYEFDSAHAGYGDRTGQILAQVITHHTAVITIQNGWETSAVMEDYWDMKHEVVIAETEIKLAPIESVTVSFFKSNPAQVNVHIVGGLPDGCTTFNKVEVHHEVFTINVIVTVQRPKNAACPAVYTTFEKDVNLGTDFKTATAYTLYVNDYKTTFNY